MKKNGTLLKKMLLNDDINEALNNIKIKGMSLKSKVYITLLRNQNFLMNFLIMFKMIANKKKKV